MCKLRPRLATRKVENRSPKDKAKEVNAINTQDKANVISHKEIKEARVLNSRINEDLHLKLVASVDHLHRGRIKVNKLERKLCIQRVNKDVNLHLDVSLLLNNRGDSPLHNNQGDSHLHSNQGDNHLHNNQGDSPLHSNLEDNLHLSSLSREINSVNSHKGVSPLPSSHNKLNNKPHLSGGKQLTDHKATQILNIPTKSLNLPLNLHGLQGQLIILSQ